MIDQEVEIADNEKGLLNSQITERKEGVKEELNLQERYEKEQRMKEILFKYANLQTPIEYNKLPKLVVNFNKLDENTKRAVFESIKLGHKKEQALIKLKQEETYEGRHK